VLTALFIHHFIARRSEPKVSSVECDKSIYVLRTPFVGGYLYSSSPTMGVEPIENVSSFHIRSNIGHHNVLGHVAPNVYYFPFCRSNLYLFTYNIMYSDFPSPLLHFVKILLG